ncbi:MAG: 50S ribosomal protein L17 [Opitutales bacterium]|jgi:large subunit ribosomal protein L17
MRHRKHNHLLGVKTAHRISLVANLSCSLIDNGRIKTTLAKARALRPSIEKAITLAKKAHATDDAAKKIHYRRQAIARLRSKDAVKKLFDELVEQFVGRNGGYTRIYKLAIPRLGDAADMAIIEFVEEIQKKKAKKKRSSKKTKPKGDTTEKIKDESPVEDASSTPVDEEKDDAQASTEESKEAVSKEVSKEEEPAPSPEVEKEDKDDSDEKKPEDK